MGCPRGRFPGRLDLNFDQSELVRMTEIEKKPDHFSSCAERVKFGSVALRNAIFCYFACFLDDVAVSRIRLSRSADRAALLTRSA